MKKDPIFSRFPFHRNLFYCKFGFSSLCHRCFIFFLLAIVVIVYLRIVFLYPFSSPPLIRSNNHIAKLTQWKFARPKRINKWLNPRMDCQRVLNGDRVLVERMAKSRRKMKDPAELEMDCEAIRMRNGGSAEEDEEMAMINGTNMTEMERQMPMAFARVVHTDYLFLEAELLVNYAHNNWYCYVLDLKSSSAFQLRMRQLASCFDNVIVVDQMYGIQGVGSNMNKAMMECARTLSDGRKQWKHLITLQNHDVQAKTNAEMAQIFTWLGGINDLEVELQLPFTRSRLEHYKQNFNWTFDELHLFKDEGMNHRTDEDGRPLTLSLSKGYMAASLSRQFVDFVVNELNVTTLLEQLNNGIFGVDEHFWQSLSSSESLNAPGGFPHQCFVKRIDETKPSFRKYKYITRFALWADPSSKCLSGHWRHSVCVFGLEDLMGPNSQIRALPHLFVNKLMQEFDFDAILCWHQWMRGRRRSGRMELDEHFYTDWPQQTRYQRERGKRREANEHDGIGTEMDCDSGMVRLKKERDDINRMEAEEGERSMNEEGEKKERDDINRMEAEEGGRRTNEEGEKKEGRQEGARGSIIRKTKKKSGGLAKKRKGRKE